MAELRLEAREFRDLTRWRWVLTDTAGGFLADHEVRLDPDSWQFEAFADLRYYVSWHAAPDRYHDDQARIVAGVGAWAGAHVLGPQVADALVRAARRAPVTVRVIVPPQARDLLFRPLELTHVHGRPLARQDITLVMRTGSTGAIAPTGDRLRILGLFSLPEGGQTLNLRRERYSLVELIRRISAAGQAADVRVLQYGVTRDRLRDVLEEAEGWDVIHISGHGSPGQLMLETAAGSPDLVTAAELADLLDLARERVKLVTVSACWSAADATADQRRLLGLPLSQEDRYTERTLRDPAPPGALATGLAERLGCAVLAMRFPVADEFAIKLSSELYRLLIEKGQPLPRAVGMTLRELRGNEYPALSMAAPAIFGETAIDLTLAAPPREPGEADYNPRPLKMAGFPPQPGRFVGRTGVMARSSAALAIESGIPGVLLHGMPGGGKTACALELAYTHEHAFDRLVWYKAPDEGTAIDGALADFALALQGDLPGLTADLVASADELTAFLPRLTELMRQRRLLIVVDNIESVLTDSGGWRDERWVQVITALTAHTTGLGRLILTTRRVPAEMPPVHAEAVGALSADEALLVARELPHLSTLVSGGLPGLDADAVRNLALGVLNIAQGHPKLLELADSQAARPEQLPALIQAGGEAWQEHGNLPAEFFTVRESSAPPDGYLRVLAAWTRATADTLTPGERDLFWLLCCLEEPDRLRFVVDAIWPYLRTRLDRHGQPPDLDRALRACAARGLAAIALEAGQADESYAIHPGVAAAGRIHAGTPFRDAVDVQTAAFWIIVFRQASGGTDDDVENTRLLVRAAVAAVPYLTRRERWDDVATLLESALVRIPSRAATAALLPAINQLTRRDSRHADVLAAALQATEPGAAEALLRTHVDTAVARGDYQAASVAASRLITLCQESGRLHEALALADQAAAYDRQAGLGPWTQLNAQVQRLQVLNDMGQASKVLEDIAHLRGAMRELPDTSGADEAAVPWRVRETLLSTGRDAAIRLGRWDDALDLNAEITASMRGRRAPVADVVRARFNDYGPLLRLGHVNEALSLLQDCRDAFHDARDINGLGKTLLALAATESARGHDDSAVRFQRDALRYSYLAGNAADIAGGYHNLGGYLSLAAYPRLATEALACHLTAALIGALTGSGSTDSSVRYAALDFRLCGHAAIPPTDVAVLCRQLGDIPGTDPAGLIARLSPDRETAERTLRALVTRARELATLAEREHD